MGHAAGDEELSVESEFAATIHYIDLYLRQKTDLFLQHYVFEPFDFLAEKFVYLSLLVTLLAAGTLVVVVGVIFLLTTVIVLWAALLITGAVLFVVGGIIAYMLFSKKIILQTPTAEEMMKRGNA